MPPVSVLFPSDVIDFPRTNRKAFCSFALNNHGATRGKNRVIRAEEGKNAGALSI